MKKALFPVLILLLVLLAGCGGEAREPVPAWPDRLAGEYDGSLTFTLLGAEPEAVGQDRLTGRMTALFSLEDGGTLALGWRRVTGGEAELLEDFLAETGGTPGIWEKDSSAPNALESYVRLGRSWYCLSAACDSLEEAALLRLVDGTVAASAGEETALPRALSSAWLEELPWAEDWLCLTLGGWELDPELGKAALHTLLFSYDWLLTDPQAEEKVYDPDVGMHRVPSTWETNLTLPDKQRLRFHLRDNGDLYWNGALYRPLGAGGGPGLIENYEALETQGEYITDAPALTLIGGETEYEAIRLGGGIWTHVYRDRRKMTYGGFDLVVPFQEVDWLAVGEPILETRGELTLHFAGREPDSLRLYAFTDPSLTVYAPIEVREGRFTPFAGVNRYVLHCTWNQVEQGGYGGQSYILLIDGGEVCGPETRENGEVLLTFTETDSYGCSFILINRGERFLDVSDVYESGRLYTLLRRTRAGGWEWVKPIRLTKERIPDTLPAGESRDWAWDWSYAYGPLEPGEYCLSLLCGLSGDRQQETLYLRQRFTVSRKTPPDLGDETRYLFQHGFTSTLEIRSPHRWVQTILTEEDRWVVERDFSLYRRVSNGYVLVPPGYRLPASYAGFQCAGEASSLAGRENLPLDVDLAAQYGELPAGTYLLRRRFLRLTEEEWKQLNGMGGGPDSLSYLWEWRRVPAERLVYGDTQFTLGSDLQEVPLPVQPRDGYLYTGGAPLAPVYPAESVFFGSGAKLTWKAAEDMEGVARLTPGQYRLYFRWGEEWFPLLVLRELSQSGEAVYLSPGEALEETRYDWSYVYPLPLLPGDYRLLVPCAASAYGVVTAGYAAADFTIS